MHCAREGSEVIIRELTKNFILIAVQCPTILPQIGNRPENNGFIKNMYETCVTKKLFNGEMMKVVWNIDDLNVSHKGWLEVKNISQYLSSIYGTKLQVHRGEIHNYLEMYLGYSELRMVKSLMLKYLQKFIYNPTEELRGTSASPPEEKLLQIRGEQEAYF